MKAIGLCSANIERSHAFEAVIGYEVAQRGLDDRIGVYSAGLNVEAILAGTPAMALQVRMLEAGLTYGVVRADIADQVRAAVDRGADQPQTDEIKVLYDEVRLMVHGINFSLINQALSEVGIEANIPPYTRLDVHQGFDLALPMEARHVQKVEERYDTAGVERPAIIPYGQLVCVDDLIEPNLHGGLVGAREKVAYFMDTRETAVDIMLTRMPTE